MDWLSRELAKIGLLAIYGLLAGELSEPMSANQFFDWLAHGEGSVDLGQQR
jgi:hypothetical protein